ncbi:hypothetical protein MFFC18_46880 [Mariniblastus fucicola]|uniref:Uncharacterized protein n=1 Tax=Mariniblastus fucicola TaxID=980251 RepID=A0A5B9PHL8_9BACT|nr:hypothetical protein MFFC18_46880 [Mariniblastus fucicola]
MPIRAPFRKQLITAWKRTIEKHYKNCLINSERSVRASLWAHLVEELPDNRCTFIEPRIRADDGNSIPRIYPDLVVCNSKSVIAVVELK